MIADWLEVDGNCVAQELHDACEMLNGAEGEVKLDFSGVRRIDTSGLHAVEDFATASEAKSVKITLRGVNVDVYKVLKLAKLTTRFTFVN